MRIVPLWLPTPYPVGPVNVYMLPGPPLTLVDCGPKTPEARSALEDGLIRAGTRIEAVERIVLTHGHVDHFGLAATVARRSGAVVIAHEADVPKLAVDRWFLEPLRAWIAEAGFPPAVVEGLVADLRRYRQQLDPIRPTQVVRDGDRLLLADGALEVVHTPGHSQGHICLWDGDRLISGDMLLDEISPNPLVEFDCEGRRVPTLPALVRSLRRAAALEPAVAYPGHGDPLLLPARRALEVIRHHARRKEDLAGRLTGPPQTLRALVEAWFPKLDQFNLVLGLSEVMGHLDLLANEGRLVVMRRGGVVYYRLRPTADQAGHAEESWPHGG